MAASIYTRLAFCLLLASLAACGGGGDDDSGCPDGQTACSTAGQVYDPGQAPPAVR